MPAPKALLNLSRYVGVLPYATELTGTFQPMIGWKGGRSSDRFEAGAARDKRKLFDRFADQFQAKVKMAAFANSAAPVGTQPPDILDIGIGDIPSRLRMQGVSMLLSKIAGRLPSEPPAAATWKDVINQDALSSIIEEEERKLDSSGASVSAVAFY